MSRIGSTPITVPSGVDIDIAGDSVTVKGPKGTLEHSMPETISVAVDDGTVTVSRANDERNSRALHGLTRSLVNNMVVGVSEGFRKDLEIIGVGYRANAKGSDKLELALGFSHSITVQAPEGVTFDVPEPTKIGVIGIDKQVVGQVAAEIRAYRKPEPYKGKGVRYVGERVVRKAGKAGK
jgi:large subunit ribosomal protein L6